MFNIENASEFHSHFTSNDVCKKFLYDLKWKNGYNCYKCGSAKYWRGRTDFHRRCALCGYDESCTAHTIFHRIKFPLLAAFGMVFQITSSKTGKSTVDLAREFGVIQATAWQFKNKVQNVMATGDASDGILKEKKAAIPLDGVIIMHRGKDLNGLQRVDLEMIRRYHSNTSKLGARYLHDNNEKELCRLVRGKFKELRTSMLLWNFKRWITGTHHHCSLAHLNGYLNEFFFKMAHSQTPGRMLQIVVENSIRKQGKGFERDLAI